jgi:hypothetical protein
VEEHCTDTPDTLKVGTNQTHQKAALSSQQQATTFAKQARRIIRIPLLTKTTNTIHSMVWRSKATNDAAVKPSKHNQNVDDDCSVTNVNLDHSSNHTITTTSYDRATRTAFKTTLPPPSNCGDSVLHPTEKNAITEKQSSTDETSRPNRRRRWCYGMIILVSLVLCAALIEGIRRYTSSDNNSDKTTPTSSSSMTANIPLNNTATSPSPSILVHSLSLDFVGMTTVLTTANNGTLTETCRNVLLDLLVSAPRSRDEAALLRQSVSMASIECQLLHQAAVELHAKETESESLDASFGVRRFFLRKNRRQRSLVEPAAVAASSPSTALRIALQFVASASESSSSPISDDTTSTTETANAANGTTWTDFLVNNQFDMVQSLERDLKSLATQPKQAGANIATSGTAIWMTLDSITPSSADDILFNCTPIVGATTTSSLLRSANTAMDTKAESTASPAPISIDDSVTVDAADADLP